MKHAYDKEDAEAIRRVVKRLGLDIRNERDRKTFVAIVRDVSTPEKGYIMHMWTGTLEGDDGLPLFFPTVKAALRALRRYPSWGLHAVTVYECTREGHNYTVGDAVASGAEAA